jgi:PhoPQ-activated pathogenicity-related protein
MPKFILVSSDDEFMSMDWTNLGYYDKLEGEKHLYIVPNTEHGLATGLFRAVNAIGTFMSSVISGKTGRPTIDYTYDRETGELSVIVPEGLKPDSVKMWHGMTFSKERRDFRWIVNANNISKIDPDCKFPYLSIPTKSHDLFETNLKTDHGP